MASTSKAKRLRVKEAELVSVLLKLCDKNGSSASAIGDVLSEKHSGLTSTSKVNIKQALQRAIRAGAVQMKPAGAEHRFKVHPAKLSSLHRQERRKGRRRGRKGRRRRRRRSRRRRRRRRTRRRRGRRRRRRGRRRGRRRSRRRRRRRGRRRKGKPRKKKTSKTKKDPPEATPDAAS